MNYSGAPPDLRLQFARFRSVTDFRPVLCERAWEEFARLLSRYATRDEKDGPLWSPTEHAPGATRGNANVLSVSAFVLDMDCGVPPREFVDVFGPFAHVVHSTHRHTAAAPRWRVVFPLAGSVPGSEWPGVYAKLAAHFGRGYGDPSCKDASRMYYWPSSPAGGIGDRIAFWRDGPFLDHRAVSECETAPKLVRVPSHAQVGRPLAAYAGPIDLARVAAGDMPDGAKHSMLIRAIRKMRGFGVDLATCRQIVAMALTNVGESRLGEGLDRALARYDRYAVDTYQKFQPDRGPKRRR